ncbi:InlB B-repeat-containing protein [uncultured Adlercreutzia sp.]|uniref:InlB B-repeat-containing protein n=1 Tax=uncultured Adlercreutzia sp. TaxID=875803 RepID=UPI0026F406BF|nr:InlB B-repeat-containing protein [uncultured Adlercreutzia sp.]
MKYVLNGGKNNRANPSKYTGKLKLKNPTKKGYTFKGWYTNKKLTKKITVVKNKSTKVYAKWNKKKYKIKYVLNGGQNSSSNASSYTISTKTFKLKSPTRNGYTFKGWYSNKKLTKKVTSIKKGSTGNITLYAKWEKKPTNPWDGVKVEAPASFGEQGYENNRMSLTKYSFREWGNSYYYMDVWFKMVKCGTPTRGNWGEYAFCYDKNGKLLDRAYLYANGIGLGKTFYYGTTIPKGTKRIVIPEYPEATQPANPPKPNTPSAPAEPEGTKWSYSDANNLKSYSTKARDCVSKALQDYLSGSNYGDGSLKLLYFKMSVSELKTALQYLESADQLASSRVTLTTTEGDTLRDVIGDAKNALSDLDKYAAMTAETAKDYDRTLSDQISSAITPTSRLQVLSTRLLEAF